MTTNDDDNIPDNVIDIHVHVNATDRLIDAISADVDITPTDNNVDDVVIRMLITLRNASLADVSPEARERARRIIESKLTDD
jgi:hypothetical protein